MLGAGGSAFAAIKLGERNEGQAEDTLGCASVTGLLAGILIAVLGIVFLNPLIKLFGASETTIEYARQYTSIILIAAPFNVLGVILSNFARTDGNPLLSMYSMLIGALLNVALDPLFIFIFRLGVAGAAYAPAISQMVSAAVLIYYCLLYTSRCV